ncbi:MAG: hypothetical protein ACTSW1_11575 [Candidatus Hodarchaeales archaeon]
MTQEESKEQGQNEILNSLSYEIDETINTTILQVLSEIQSRANDIIAIFNKSDQKFILLTLLNSLLTFNQTIIGFPMSLRQESDEIIKIKIKDCLSNIKKILRKVDMLFWITRHRIDDVFIESHPVLDYMEECIQTVLDFLSDMRLELHASLSTIIEELDSIKKEIIEASNLFGKVSYDVLTQFFIDALQSWNRDIVVLESYWKDKVHSYYSKFSQEIDSMRQEQKRLTIFINQQTLQHKKERVE